MPYYRGFATQRNQNTVGFGRMFQLYRGAASSDRARTHHQKGLLTTELARNSASPVRASTMGKELQGVTGGKRERLKQAARQVLMEYQGELSAPFYQDVDSNNGFAQVNVTGAATKALAEVEDALKQSVAA